MGTTSLEASCGKGQRWMIKGLGEVVAMRKSRTDHAGAGEDIPAQTNAITVLDLAPLLLERFVIHIDVDGVLGG